MSTSTQARKRHTDAQPALPYSHMDEKDGELFYTTMNELLLYANRRLGLVDPALLRPCEDEQRLLLNGALVAEALWRRRFLVDDFVRENPGGLGPEALDVARGWRHAVRDCFVCVGANADVAFYMNRDRIFAVGAMQDDADDHVRAIPSIDLLTLLPFKGGVVTDGKTIHLSAEPLPGVRTTIRAQAERLLSQGIISTASELARYGAAIPDGENRVDPGWQRRVDAAFAAGTIR